ncbi:MAG TPA: recombinase family protein [Candidatus Faecousia faecavium]|nr:recombinase family protein [Candidatus Faecousia faecavium]
MRVWLYYRLSRDEDKQFNSLKNQYSIIESYALNNGHTIVGSSFDDNVSGMHFNRAGIDELTEAVENGMIDAVIVKDLSRLGRHKTQTALYIDYLRQNNVRVLSATESIDTFNEADDLIIGFKGLMNDFYARDGSRRVTAGLRQKQKAGLVITPPFGYFKDKNTKQVVIVPEAAETVHLIFSSYLDGMGVKAIAAKLNEIGHKTPALMQKHLTGKRLPEKQELIIKKYLWDATMVSRILQDESYTGTLICHKSERNKINKTNRITSPDEQFRHENFLPTIIPRDLWEQVQTLMAMRKRESVRAGEGRPILRYSGLIACGDCGRAFTGKRVKQKNGERVEYICSTYLRYGKEHCGAHAIREEYLDDIVRQELQNTKHQYQTLWTQLEKAIEGWLPKTTNTQQQLKKQQERIELLEEEVETILMERIRDKENAQRYDRMIAKREEQIANAQKRIAELENIGQIIRSRQAKLRKDIGLIDDILADGKISEAHLRMLIDRIFVYETEGGLSLEIKVKAPFQNHTDSYENGVLTNSEIAELIGVS